MSKSLRRDGQILEYILKNQLQIIRVLKDFKCDLSSTPNSVINNKYAFDLCAMYMAQIGENVKLLTDSSKEVIGSVLDIGSLRYFRNIIDHNYEKVNKHMLKAYIQSTIRREALAKVKERHDYCVAKSRK